mmetsp:Transcript_49646/g.98173  ORF Transcript_49646/g.98173 Transcript_49646/m.98173 type:complete len:114 (-) Transcript_49646:8-349(-)
MALPGAARPSWICGTAAALALLLSAALAADEPKPSEAELAEYKQDFYDFDLNKDDQIDPQEVRMQFKGQLDPRELHQFFMDVDKDHTGTVTLQEYIDYATSVWAAAQQQGSSS